MVFIFLFSLDETLLQALSTTVQKKKKKKGKVITTSFHDDYYGFETEIVQTSQ